MPSLKVWRSDGNTRITNDTFNHFHKKFIKNNINVDEDDSTICETNITLIKTFIKCILVISFILVMNQFIQYMWSLLLYYNYYNFYMKHELDYVVNITSSPMPSFLWSQLMIHIFFNQYSKNSFIKIGIISFIINFIFGIIVIVLAINFDTNKNFIYLKFICRLNLTGNNEDTAYFDAWCPVAFSLFFL